MVGHEAGARGRHDVGVLVAVPPPLGHGQVEAGLLLVVALGIAFVVVPHDGDTHFAPDLVGWQWVLGDQSVVAGGWRGSGRGQTRDRLGGQPDAGWQLGHPIGHGDEDVVVLALVVVVKQRMVVVALLLKGASP